MRHRAFPVISIAAALVLVGAGCAAPSRRQAASVQSASSPAVSADAGPSSGSASADIDVHAIPLGDEKVAVSPKAGYVYSCVTTFDGGGAEHAGNWIQGDTWDATKKIHVEGNVSWPDAAFSALLNGDTRRVTGNGLPVGEPTGIFPVQITTLAYQYDRNPNSIRTQDVRYDLPADPQFAAAPSCVPMGAVGIALDGVAIYNALDADGRDAVAHEVQDLCEGHPQSAGEYHYHGPSDCMPHADEPNALVGYALDGFGITSMYDADGNEYTNADLDECHGTTSEIEWDGQKVVMYHYVLTREYPYTVGCFRGTPVRNALRAAGAGGQPPAAAPGNGGGTPAQGGGTPPSEAVTACDGSQEGEPCALFNGQVIGACHTTPDGSFACVP